MVPGPSWEKTGAWVCSQLTRQHPFCETLTCVLLSGRLPPLTRGQMASWSCLLAPGLVVGRSPRPREQVPPPPPACETTVSGRGWVRTRSGARAYVGSTQGRGHARGPDGAGAVAGPRQVATCSSTGSGTKRPGLLCPDEARGAQPPGVVLQGPWAAEPRETWTCHLSGRSPNSDGDCMSCLRRRRKKGEGILSASYTPDTGLRNVHVISHFIRINAHTCIFTLSFTEEEAEA